MSYIASLILVSGVQTEKPPVMSVEPKALRLLAATRARKDGFGTISLQPVGISTSIGFAIGEPWSVAIRPIGSRAWTSRVARRTWRNGTTQPSGFTLTVVGWYFVLHLRYVLRLPLFPVDPLALIFANSAGGVQQAGPSVVPFAGRRFGAHP